MDYEPGQRLPLQQQWPWPLPELTWGSSSPEDWWLECLGGHPACTGVWGRTGQPCVQDAPWSRMTTVSTELAKPISHVLPTNKGFSVGGYIMPDTWCIMWFFFIIKYIVGFSFIFFIYLFFLFSHCTARGGFSFKFIALNEPWDKVSVDSKILGNKASFHAG